MGSLTVHVLDHSGRLVRGKKVFCNFPGSFLGFIGTHSERYTDGNGTAEFDEVPVCTVQVFVEGQLQVEVGVGAGAHKDVTVHL